MRDVTVHRCHGSVRTSVRASRFDTILVQQEKNNKSTMLGFFSFILMIFPPLSGMLDPCQSSSNNWKLISFDTTWLLPKLKKQQQLYISLYSFLPLLACTYLNNAWELVLWTLNLSDCLFKMNRSMYSPIVSRFG